MFEASVIEGEPMAEERRLPTMDERVRELVSAGQIDQASSALVRELGPEVYGFLRGVLRSDADADEVFATTSERAWRSLGAFRWQCSLRTWVYVIARHEMARFVAGERRRNAGRATPSELDDAVAVVRTETRSALRSDKLDRLRALRDELPIDDRTLLILRVDRNLEWIEIARAFLSDVPDAGATDELLRREAARLRKRFQLIKERLAERARQEGLFPS